MQSTPFLELLQIALVVSIILPCGVITLLSRKHRG